MYVNFLNKLNFKKCAIKLQSEVVILNIGSPHCAQGNINWRLGHSNHIIAFYAYGPGPMATERIAYML